MDELKLYREQIDEIDAQMVALFERRMNVVRRVGAYKARNGMRVQDERREERMIERRVGMLRDASLAQGATRLFETLLELSRREQEKTVQ